MPATVAAVTALIEQVAPPRLAESWDRCGLAVGDPAWKTGAVALALDATVGAVEFALNHSARLLLVHHPPVFQPLTTLREDRPAGRLLALAVRKRVAIYAAHTSFDSAPGGMNDYVAARLGLDDVSVLAPAGTEPYYKLVVFVPEPHAERVAGAIFAAGGGVIGDYTHCAFRHPGTGSFLPGAGADPYSGSRGEISFEPELRLEVRVPRDRLAAITKAMIAAHPYEEVAYDAVLLAGGETGGLGRTGTLAKTARLGDFADACRQALSLRSVRVVGKPSARVRTVALCTGGGSSLLAAAAASGADVYVTGDVSYHMARDAEDAGLALIDVGHFGSERIFADAMKRPLGRLLKGAGLAVRLLAFRGEKDPFANR